MFYRVIAVVLCLMMSMLPCWSEPPQGNQRAGEISALIPAAERNSKPTKAKDEVDWNDQLKTEQKGRLRAMLTDGSSLSMGSNTEMKVLQHDASSQQTSLQMGVGAMRSRVVKITNPNGKFEVRTPQAVIGVVGTDFYTRVTPHRTMVICYSGTVQVTPLGAAKIMKKDSNGNQSSSNEPTTVDAGNMIEVGDDLVGTVQQASSQLQQQTIAETDVPEIPVGVAVAGHGLRNTIIGLAVGGALGGAVAGTVKSGNAPSTGCPIGVPPSQCGIRRR